MIHLSQVAKRYHTSEYTLTVLEIGELTISRGESVALVGPSGSGKSTLLSLIAGLDRPSQGEVFVGSKALNELSEDELSLFRLEHIGFVFQSFQLLDNLTALENILVPGELLRIPDRLAQAKALLSEVGLEGREGHFPFQLSGGEQQRVAIARAFMGTREIILADEPTGNLDWENGERIQNLLLELNRSHGTTLVVATHDLEFADRLSRKLRLRNGRL